jgi:hypothetical protein
MMTAPLPLAIVALVLFTSFAAASKDATIEVTKSMKTKGQHMVPAATTIRQGTSDHTPEASVWYCTAL